MESPKSGAFWGEGNAAHKAKFFPTGKTSSAGERRRGGVEMMDNIMMWIKFVAGAVCSFCTALFGGLDAVLVALLAFIALDYLTGLMVAVYTKTVSSEIGYKGLLKKVGILIKSIVLFVLSPTILIILEEDTLL